MLAEYTESSHIQHHTFHKFMSANVCLSCASEWLPSQLIMIAMA
jgi:hypothetical protein